MYFPQHDSHVKTVTMKEIEALLRREGLIPEDSCLERSEMSCYCYSDNGYCTCLPEALTFSWYTTKSNLCDTCGATGSNPCQTSGGKRTKYHKNRKIVEPSNDEARS